MHEEELLFAGIVPKRGLVLALVEEVQNGAVRTARQHHAIDRETHVARQTQRISRFQVRDVRRKGDRLRILHAVEVGVEEDGQLAEHADDVSAVGRDDVDAVAMHVACDQVARYAEHFGDPAVLRSTRCAGPTSMHRL